MAVKIGGRSIYFACDTGYCPGFKQTGEKVGPFDLSLIPIGIPTRDISIELTFRCLCPAKHHESRTCSSRRGI